MYGRRYTPDLNRLMAQCERNYLRLQQLVPQLQRLSDAAYSYPDGVSGLELRVLERSRYTTVLMLSQAVLHGATSVAGPRMQIRVYHDARLAEVLSYQGRARLQPRYPYPNPEMMHPDEKQQLNQFLGEWLEHCLARGHRFQPQEAVTDL
jgi:uncharacterized protein YqiB (DUF1249 family)